MSLLTGIVHARLCGRQLVVDWRDKTYSSDRSNAFPLLFECAAAGSVDEIPATESVTPELWRGHLDGSVVDLQRLHPELSYRGFGHLSSIDPVRLDHPHEVAVLWQYMPQVHRIARRHPRRVQEAFGSRDAALVVRRLITSDLVPAADIRERVAEFRDRHFADEVVGVHVRYGRIRSALGRIRAELDRMRRKRPELQIFLATDGIEVLDELQAAYPNVISTPHWYPPRGEEAHQNRHCPDRLENAREALVDLYLLASCDRLVVDTTSSFARLAGILANGRSPIHDASPRSRRIMWRAATRTMIRLNDRRLRAQ